ncbi:hydrogenase maturation factor HoxX [Kitasatospora herbaricolor]|uniref:hydrogenase maturation protein n=1 Tax=Kitasatospora herbaricolor TaxID=68217 RepID=UPI00174D58B9|nr:hydrogenase maturation protein [Kitasatospora herbaricolor]MDQ0313115.1 putative two-component system hydrogenase maturation factor HypX/HoxX [Kitasatospora herbaricolor]GGV39998.1 hydrogenase maturation factor HoxX [Kitasatospora herbaricolor]
MRVLLLASAFNSLTQRVFAELRDHGHRLTVHLACGDELLREALRRDEPDLVLAPMLKAVIPPDVWSRYPCLVVHPGPPGDRGPSSLDWAIHEGAGRWGVTVLQADGRMDGGDVWATAEFPVPPVGKSDLYRNEASDAAVRAVLLAVRRFASGTYRPRPQHGPEWDAPEHVRPYFDQGLRAIDWAADPTELVLRKLRAADSQPGVLDELLGAEWYLHGGHLEDELRGRPGELLATRTGAVCRATADGAVWIPELRPRRRPGGPETFKLPAVLALGARLPELPELPAPLELPEHRRTWAEIGYREQGPVGLLRFSFPGGAMSTGQCRRLLTAYRFACSRPTSVLVLGGGRDFFSNGIHLNVIEAAADPAEESWANINAMDDLVEAVLTTTDRLVLAALGGNASAGGVALALAADQVWCRDGVVLNPHYRLMGLYGSEYWTYTLPRRVGATTAERLTRSALPLTAAGAQRLGLVDRVIEAPPGEFGGAAARLAGLLAAGPAVDGLIAAKKAARERDEARRPLAGYRERELALMHRNFFAPAEPYHALRSAFVRKRPRPGTPAHLDPGLLDPRAPDLPPTDLAGTDLARTDPPGRDRAWTDRAEPGPQAPPGPSPQV